MGSMSTKYAKEDRLGHWQSTQILTKQSFCGMPSIKDFLLLITVKENNPEKQKNT